MNVFKRLMYRMVKQDSRNMAKIGNAIGWQWLEDEGNRNVKNPGRAVGKAAAAAATWYLGGLGAGASAAGTGAGAGAAAAGGGAAELASVGAAEAAKQAAMQSAMQAGTMSASEFAAQQAAQEAAKQAAMQAAQQGSLLGPLTQSQTFAANTGPVASGGEYATMLGKPPTMLDAARYGGQTQQGILGSMKNWAGAKGAAVAKNPMGFLGDVGENYAKAATIANTVAPPQQEQQAPPPPPPQSQSRMPEFGGYGGGILGGGMPPELAGLPPDDPRVIEWMRRQQGRMQNE